MLMYLLAKAILAVYLPIDLVVGPVTDWMGLNMVADNPGYYTTVAPHGGAVSSPSPVAVLFSSMGIANRFLPIYEYFAFIFPAQLVISSVALAMSIVRVLLRFVPGITAG